MKVKAKRNDSFLGIVAGETYNAEIVNGGISGRIRVYTNGYVVMFNEKDFDFVTDEEVQKEIDSIFGNMSDEEFYKELENAGFEFDEK
jgi:hypothetical protein